MNLFRWASTTVLRHVVLVGGLFALCQSVFFGYLFYTDGTLTLASGVRIAAVSSACGVIAALLGWYTIMVPMLKRRGDRPARSGDGSV